LRYFLKKTNKKSVQNNIKRSKDRGVRITQMNTIEDYQVYHKILTKHRNESGLSSYSFADVGDAMYYLKSLGQTGFIAWMDNTPIGGILVSSFNGYINEWGIARSIRDTEEKLYSQELLRWTIIEWGIENKCKFYDISGVKLSERTPKEEGIFRNKKKFGGTLFEYPTISR